MPLHHAALPLTYRCAAALLLTLCSMGCPQPVDAAGTANAAPVEPANVRAEVSALLSTQAEDWSAGRLEAFCGAYAEDAVFVSPKGVTRGRAGILARYDKRYRQDGHEMGHLTLTVDDIDAQPNHASVVMKWHLQFKAPRDGGPADAQGHSLVTLRRRDTGVWEVIHDASM